MNPNTIQSGYWTATDERFVNCYPTLPEAEAHVKFQKERFGKTLHIYKIEVKIQKL